MKLYVLLTLAFFAPETYAANTKIITKEEASQVLTEIDNICGDTWCEGDFGYDFKSFNCFEVGAENNRRAECELKFEMISTDYVYDEKDMEIQMEKNYPVQCTFKGLKREDIIEQKRSGGVTYSEVLIDKVNDCVSKLEKHIWDSQKK